ncbi:MAG: hypothetical protein IPN79_10550 [Saprospiraceae bacterium]|nr:hypothetical protein [Saprospiraceae bacterium]
MTGIAPWHIYLKNLVLIAFAVACTACFFIFSKSDFRLEEISHLSFSKATAEGVDISSRANMLYINLFVFLSVFFSTLFFLRKTIHKHLPFFSVSSALSLILIVALYTALIWKTHAGTYQIPGLLLLFTLLVSLFQSNNDKSTIYDTETLVITFACSYSFSLIFGWWHFAMIILQPIVLMIWGFVFISLVMFQMKERARQKLFIYTLLRFFIFFHFIFFIVKGILPAQGFWKGPGDLWFIACVMSGMSAFLYSNYQKKFEHNPIKTSYFRPTFFYVVALFLWSVPYPYYIQNADVFELANPANAVMRIFQFNEIPFLDFFTSHLFSEQWYGILYGVLFGYDGSLDFMSFAFLNDLILLIVVYYVLQKIWNHQLYPALVILFFPLFQLLFFKHIFMTVIGYFYLEKVFEKQNVKNIVIFLTITVLLLVWRLDTGIAFLYGLVIFLPYRLFSGSEKFQVSSFIKASGYFLCGVLVIFLAAIYLKGFDTITERLQMALAYVTTQQEHGLPLLSWQENHHVYFQYILLPLAALSLLIDMFFRIKKTDESQLLTIYRLSAFFAVVFLANFQRSLVRHSFLMEMDNLLMSTFVFSLILYLAGRFKSILTPDSLFPLVYAGSFLAIVTIKYHDISPSSIISQQQEFFSEKSYLFDKNKGRGTVKDSIFMASQVDSIKLFLDNHLSAEATFLDFSNSPMLYFYTQKKQPGYFCQNLQNTVGDKSQVSLIQSVESLDVPVVIYNQQPLGWGDKIDDIPNQMRYYLVNEFIYKNYVPYTEIHQKNIWVNQKMFQNLPVPVKKATPPNMSYDYRYSAAFAGKFLMEEKPEYLLYYTDVRSDSLSSNTMSFTFSDLSLRDANGVFVILNINQPSEGETIHVHLMTSDGNKSGHFSFITKEDQNNYALRLTNEYTWFQRNIKGIWIENTQNKNILATFVKDKRI